MDNGLIVVLILTCSPAEATLTVANLCSVLKEVEWGTLTGKFGVPWSTLEEIQSNYSTVKQRRQAMLEEWLDHHPAPSWMLVVNALYRAPFMGDGYCGYGKYNKVIQLVKQKYLKGMEISAYTSIQVIRLWGVANCIV